MVCGACYTSSNKAEVSQSSPKETSFYVVAKLVCNQTGLVFQYQLNANVLYGYFGFQQAGKGEWHYQNLHIMPDEGVKSYWNLHVGAKPIQTPLQPNLPHVSLTKLDPSTFIITFVSKTL